MLPSTSTQLDSYIDSIIQGNCLEILEKMPSECIDTIITSPPYWGLRDYGEETKVTWTDGWYGQLGLEPTLELYLNHLLQITAELRRVLKPSGVMFWNMGDCYGSHRDWGWSDIPLKKQLANGGRQQGIKGYEKCMMMQNYRLVLRMVDEQGWILRNTIIWNKPNHMPSSVKDRFASSYEPVFMLVQNRSYWFDLDAVRVPSSSYKPFNLRVRDVERGYIKSGQYKASGKEIEQYHEGNVVYHSLGKNPGDVWTVPTQPFSGAHFATFPEKLVEPMIKAGCPAEPGIVLDPFAGAGTTCAVAKKLGRHYIGIELSRAYCQMAERRIGKVVRQAELILSC